MLRALILAAMAFLAEPALALDASASTVTCAGAVTTGLGTRLAVRDLSPTDLPVLAFHSVPKDREYKQLARFGAVQVRMFVYRVSGKELHLQLFEPTTSGNQVLADVALAGELPELSYRAPGGDQIVTVYCY